MAAGDVTLAATTPRQVSNVWALAGTIEVDDQLRAFKLTSSKSRILEVACLQDVDGVGRVTWDDRA